MGCQVDKQSNNKVTRISVGCLECYGAGQVSQCCNEPMDEPPYHLCSGCGKFARADYCYMCDRTGQVTYEIGSEIYVYIGIYSDDYIFELYKPKKYGDSKIFYGVIRAFTDDERYAIVKLEGKRNLRQIKIEDITLNV